MLRRAHVLFAMAVGFVLVRIIGMKLDTDASLVILFSAIGGLIPDIDLSRGHRKLFHNIFAIVFFAVALPLLAGRMIGLDLNTPYLMLATLSGELSHVFLDMLTVQGVAILYPLSKTRVRIMNLNTRDPHANRIVELLSTLIIAYTALSMSYTVP